MGYKDWRDSRPVGLGRFGYAGGRLLVGDLVSLTQASFDVITGFDPTAVTKYTTVCQNIGDASVRTEALGEKAFLTILAR